MKKFLLSLISLCIIVIVLAVVFLDPLTLSAYVAWITPGVSMGTSSEARKEQIVLLDALVNGDSSKCDSLNTVVWFSIADPRMSCHTQYKRLEPVYRKCADSDEPLSCLYHSGLQYYMMENSKFCNSLYRRVGEPGIELVNLCAIGVGSGVVRYGSEYGIRDGDESKTIAPCKKVKPKLARELCIAESAQLPWTCKPLVSKTAKSTCYYRMAQMRRDEVDTLCRMVFTNTVDGLTSSDCFEGVGREPENYY